MAYQVEIFVNKKWKEIECFEKQEHALKHMKDLKKKDLNYIRSIRIMRNNVVVDSVGEEK